MWRIFTDITSNMGSVGISVGGQSNDLLIISIRDMDSQ
jgi:hypothetical protein